MPRTHVGLNLIFLVPGETGGMEVFARELIAALAAEPGPFRFTAFVNREAAGQDLPVPAVEVPVCARRRVEWVRGEQALLPRLARAHGVELLHSLASTAPAWGPYRRVVTVHDLIYRAVPEAHFGLRALGMRALVPLAVRSAHRVMADSASTREDLARFLGTPRGKVDVVPGGVRLRPGAAPLPERAVRARHGLGERPLLLSVSAKRPHKNLRRLLDALASLPADERPVLVLPGYPTPHEAELRDHAAALGVADDVRFPAWVSAEELEGLYAAAAGFVFPSLYEGFGLPVLEAMARGVPVACSDRSSLPEVAGAAALLFDPEDAGAIAGALRALLAGGPDVDRLRAAGRRQAERFSWGESARLARASYERALSARAAPGRRPPSGG